MVKLFEINLISCDNIVGLTIKTKSMYLYMGFFFKLYGFLRKLTLNF